MYIVLRNGKSVLETTDLDWAERFARQEVINAEQKCDLYETIPEQRYIHGFRSKFWRIIRWPEQKIIADILLTHSSILGK